MAHHAHSPGAGRSFQFPIRNCYDDIIHDSGGTPHVERHCYPATSPWSRRWISPVR